MVTGYAILPGAFSVALKPGLSKARAKENTSVLYLVISCAKLFFSLKQCGKKTKMKDDSYMEPTTNKFNSAFHMPNLV